MLIEITPSSPAVGVMQVFVDPQGGQVFIKLSGDGGVQMRLERPLAIALCSMLANAHAVSDGACRIVADTN